MHDTSLSGARAAVCVHTRPGPARAWAAPRGAPTTAPAQRRCRQSRMRAAGRGALPRRPAGGGAPACAARRRPPRAPAPPPPVTTTTHAGGEGSQAPGLPRMLAPERGQRCRRVHQQHVAHNASTCFPQRLLRGTQRTMCLIAARVQGSQVSHRAQQPARHVRAKRAASHQAEPGQPPARIRAGGRKAGGRAAPRQMTGAAARGPRAGVRGPASRRRPCCRSAAAAGPRPPAARAPGGQG